MAFDIVVLLCHKAVDIVDALAGYVKKNGVKIINERVTRIICENGVLNGIKTDSAFYV